MNSSDLSAVVQALPCMEKKKLPSVKRRKRIKALPYDPVFAEKLLAFFNIPAFEVVETVKKDGTVCFVEKAAQLPTFAAFARTLGVSQALLKKWESKYPRFAEAVKKARDLQGNILIQNSLRGNYSSSFAVFTAKNILGWSDGKEETKKQDGIVKVKWEE